MEKNQVPHNWYYVVVCVLGIETGNDMEHRCSSLKRGDITISPQKVEFINHGILFVTEEGKSDSLDEGSCWPVLSRAGRTEQSGPGFLWKRSLLIQKDDFSSARFTVHGVKSKQSGWALRQGNCWWKLFNTIPGFGLETMSAWTRGINRNGRNYRIW